MTQDTINDDLTRAGGGAMLANRYRVVKQLGQGGMGSVWLAEDTQLDSKQFAIKMLPSILVRNKRAYRQLKDEALVAMKLTHQNIVTLRAFEENNGNPFLVMDYIDGQTLDDYLAEKGALGEDEVIRVLRPIAAALDYAHGEGVVHRDVKPANVMIRKDGHPFILDFGIAREIQETLTRVTGKLSSGTLLYMSPEQLNGDTPKPAQDIYSFAAMAYECLKGEPPFVRGAIEDQIKNKSPEPLPGGTQLVASVMAGLAKKPEDRPKSCAGVLEVNVSRRDAEAQSGRAGTPRPPQRDDFSHKEHKAHKGSGMGKVLGLLALLAALGGGGAWYYHQQQEAARREQARIAAERRAQDETARKTEEERRRRAEAERLAAAKAEAERKAQEAVKAEAAEIRIEAVVQKGKVDSISDDDGFKTRKDALADAFTRAEALFDEKVKRWSEAAVLFTNYVDGCKTLIELDIVRHAAKKSKAESESAKFRASEAAAAQYAETRWNAANGFLEEANNLFGERAFADATSKYVAAAKQFDLCVDEAKTERKRREDEAAAKAKVEQEMARAAAERERQRVVSDSGHEKVQLWTGGPYWATTNIGAERPEDYGYYFWWGDTVGYKRVGDAWVASDGSSQNFSFEGNTPTYGESYNTLKREGWITENGVLAPEHDAACRHWGGSWRMPTAQELDGLKSKCDWTWTAMNGVNGYVVRGKDAYASASIFLPCAGLGDGTSLNGSGSDGLYWSSVPYSGSDYARDLSFYSGYHGTGYSSRGYGFSVRPVQGFTK